MTRVLVAAVVLAALCVQHAVAKPALRDPPYAIAHRGLSGVFPEHTRRAYLAAISAGADFIECDVVPTKDCQLICRHEPELAATTDALVKFPQLARTINIDGYNFTGVFSFDLTLRQIKTLRARQQVTIRDQTYNDQFDVPTLSEYLTIALSASRAVGVYPETKHPSFHDSLNLGCWRGRTFTEAVVDTMKRHGYDAPIGSDEWLQKPAYIQSFERNNLLAVASRTNLPLVFLTSSFSSLIPYDTITYGALVDSPSELAMLYEGGIRGIGPSKNTLVGVTSKNYINQTTIASGVRTMAALKNAGFQVHIYTLRNEPRRPDNSGYLPWDFQADPYMEYDLFFKRLGVDGAFTDQVHTLARYMGKK